MKLKVYTDWGSRWNPWLAWVWIYITDIHWKIYKKSYKDIWVKTCNEAEYLWAYYGIIEAIDLWAKTIYLFMDSDLVIKQLSWERKTRKDKLKDINIDIYKLIIKNEIKIFYNWIWREHNRVADRLVNIGLDTKQKELKKQKELSRF